MRAIKTLEDAAIVLRELSNWKDQVSTKGMDLKGSKITNAGRATDASDYVRLDQLSGGTAAAAPSTQSFATVTRVEKQATAPQYYTIVFSKDGDVDAGDTIPSFIVGNGREGIPHQLWLMCRQAPNGGVLSINVTVRTIDPVTDLDVNTDLLTDPLEFPDSGVRKVYTSDFATNTPRISNLAECFPTVVESNGAGIVSIGLVVKLI